jgi:hypothetical protein
MRTLVDILNVYIAPEGCLQYYTNNAGTFSSFNYMANTGYLSSLDYAICIKKSPKTCSVRYTAMGTFNLTTDGAYVNGESCQNDYLVIPQVGGRAAYNEMS